MIVNLKGAGQIKFPDGMTLPDIKAALREKFPDLTTPAKPVKSESAEILKSIQKTLEKKPNQLVIKEPVEVTKQIVVEKPVFHEVEKQVFIEKPLRATEWEFDIIRDSDDLITTVRARAIDG